MVALRKQECSLIGQTIEKRRTIIAMDTARAKEQDRTTKRDEHTNGNAMASHDKCLISRLTWHPIR